MDELISKREALASIKALYPNMMPIVDYFGARRKWFEKNKPYFECENAIMSLQHAKQEPKTGHWIEISRGFECDQCHGIDTDGLKPPYCKWCGAKMIKSQERSEE